MKHIEYNRYFDYSFFFKYDVKNTFTSYKFEFVTRREIKNFEVLNKNANMGTFKFILEIIEVKSKIEIS